VPDPKAVTDYTIKTIDVLGLGTGVTFAVLGAVGVGAALSPAALAFLSLGVVDRLLGVAVGLVQSRQRWGAEINAGLLSRLGATAKEKLHQRKLDTLKNAAGDSLRAKAAYVGAVTADLHKLREEHRAFTQRADEILQQIQRLDQDTKQHFAEVKAGFEKLVREARANPLSQAAARAVQEATEKYNASAKALVDEREKLLLAAGADLDERGMRTINEAAVAIERLEQDLAEVERLDWSGAFGDRGPIGIAHRAARAAAGHGEDAITLASIGLDVAEMAGAFDAQSVVTIVQDTVVLAGMIRNALNGTRKWKGEAKTLGDLVKRLLTEAKLNWNKSLTDPREKARYLELAKNKLAELQREARRLRERQAAEERVVQDGFNQANAKYASLAERHAAARRKYDDALRRFDAAAGKYKGVRGIPRELAALFEREHKAREAFEKLERELEQLTSAVLEFKREGADVLNIGHEQDINKLGAEIETLEREMARRR
jgi:chromosome segregation ATPase